MRLGFRVSAAATDRPSYHPAVLLKLCLYGYLNRVQSIRRLEREAQRNIELMWLTARLAPDFKTISDFRFPISDFRRDNGPGIRNAFRQFVLLCRELDLFANAAVAIDGSKFKAVNAHDRNLTRGKAAGLEEAAQLLARLRDTRAWEVEEAWADLNQRGKGWAGAVKRGRGALLKAYPASQFDSLQPL